VQAYVQVNGATIPGTGFAFDGSLIARISDCYLINRR